MSDPLDYTAKYNTALTPDEEVKYQAWVKGLANASVYDYDMRGAFKAGAGQAANGHFTDQFKKPNHPTFSDQSQYSTKETPGGSWSKNPDGSWAFAPGAHTLALHDPEDLRAYFRRVEPTNLLALPAPKPTLGAAVEAGIAAAPAAEEL